MTRSDRKIQIIQIIEKNPGIQFSEIMRKTGMKNGVLSHYARKLEDGGTIVVERTPRVTRYYPLGIDKNQTLLIKNLRQETPRNILMVLLEEGPLIFNAIFQKVNRSPSTVSINLTQLIQDEIIESRFSDQKRTFQIKNREIVQSIVEKYHPDIIAKSVDRVGDIFSSL